MDVTPESLLARFRGRPALMEPGRLACMLRGAMDRAQSVSFAQAVGLAPAPAPYERYGSVAVVSVRGTLVSGSVDLLDQYRFELLGYDDIVGAVQAAAEDDRVESIVLSIDSPGGEAAGSFESVEAIRRAAGDRPLVALANSWAASAAYLVATSASKVFMTKAAGVGSVGVVLAHVDMSQLEAEMGLKVTLLHRGERKVDGSPHQALSPEAYAQLMGTVETLYGMFVDAVASARGVPPEAVRAQESRMFVGSQADGTGLVDGVHSLAGLIEELQGGSSMATKPAGAPAASGRGGPPSSSIEDSPEAVAQAFPQAAAAMRRAGAEAERTRIAELHSLARPGFEAELGDAIGQGLSAAEFCMALRKAELANPARAQLATLRKEGDLGVGSGEGIERVSAGKQDPRSAAEAKFKADTELASTFNDDFDIYLYSEHAAKLYSADELRKFRKAD